MIDVVISFRAFISIVIIRMIHKVLDSSLDQYNRFTFRNWISVNFNSNLIYVILANRQSLIYLMLSLGTFRIASIIVLAQILIMVLAAIGFYL